MDWNENDSTKEEYVKNRTHWEEDAELTLVELENVHGSYIYFDFAEPIVAGETYTMIASGFSPDSLNTTETVIAESPLGGTDLQIYNSNGLSFIQREVPPSQAEGKHGQFNGPTGGNVTLIKQASIVHQLDPKYVPITDFVYVDKTNGDDENNGSYNSPVKTLEKGIELSNIDPRKYIKFKDTGEIHIESPSSDNEYKFVENVDFRLMTDYSQTICFDKGFYNIKKEFKVRGAGNFTNVDENNANYPLAYNKSNIDIDVTGDVTFDGYWFTKFDNVADLDSIISIKCKTFNSNFHFSYSVIPEANSHLLNNVWPSISIDADKVISRQTGAPLYKVKIKANKFEVAEKENAYFAPIQAYYLDLDIKEFYVPDCAWSGSDATYKINLFKLEANYNSTYCQTNNIHSYLDLPMSKMKIGKLSLPKLTKSGSLNEQKFCMFNFDSSTTYSDYVIAPYLDLQIDTLDLTRTFSGNVHYGLYDIYANGSTITGNCNSILLPESSNAAQKMIYPWDFQWYRPINYNVSKDPVDNFKWNFQTSPVDIYVDFGAPATGNDGRSKEHPISSMSELKKAFNLATAGIKIHVMSGSSQGIYAGNATSLGLDFSTITPTAAMKHISIVGEFSNSEIRIYGLKAQASLEIYNFKDVYLSNCYFPTNTLDSTMGIVNIHNVVQLYVDNCKFHSLSTIKCCKFYDNGGNDYASSFSLNTDEIQNIAIAGGTSGSSVMPGTVKINCNGDINSMSINKNGGKVDVFANGYINVTNNASSQVELNITGTNNVNFTQRGESSNLKLKVESTSSTLDIISYNKTSYSDSNIIRNSEISFKGKDVETGSSYSAGLPLWFYSSYVSINAEKDFYDRGSSNNYTKLFIDGQTRLKIDADWIEWNPDYTGSTSMSSGLYTSQFQYLELNAHRVNFDWKNAVYQQLIINADEVVFNNFSDTHYCHEYIWNIGTLTINHSTESCGWFELMDYNVNTTFCAEQLLTRNDLPISKINVDHIINNRQSYGNPSQPLFYVNMMASYTHPTKKYPGDSGYTVFLGCRLHLNVGVYEMPKLNYYGTASSSYKKLVGTSGAPGCEVSGACQHVSIGGIQNETAKQWMWDLQGLALTNYSVPTASKYNDQNSFNFYYAEYTNWCDYYIDYMIGSDANSGHDEQHPMKTFAGLIQKYSWSNSSNALPMMRLHIGTPTDSYLLSEAQSSTSRIILDFTNVYTQCLEIVGNPNMSECVIQGLSNSSICYIHDFKHLYLDSCTFTGSSKISSVNNLYLYNCTLSGNISVEANQLQVWDGVDSDSYSQSYTLNYNNATAINGFCRINAGGNGSYLCFKPQYTNSSNHPQFTLNIDGYVSNLNLYNFRNGRISIKSQEIYTLYDYGCCNCYMTVESTDGVLYYYLNDPDTTAESSYQIINGKKHLMSAHDLSVNTRSTSSFCQELIFDADGNLGIYDGGTFYNSSLYLNSKKSIYCSSGVRIDNHYTSGSASIYAYANNDITMMSVNGGGDSQTIYVYANCGDTYNATSGNFNFGNFTINAGGWVGIGANQVKNYYKIHSNDSVSLMNGGFYGCTFEQLEAARTLYLGGGWNVYNGETGNILNANCDIFNTSANTGSSGADNFNIKCRKWYTGSQCYSFKTWTLIPSLQSSFEVYADELECNFYPIMSLGLPRWWGQGYSSDISCLKKYKLHFDKITYTGTKNSNPFIFASGSPISSGDTQTSVTGYIDCVLEFDFGVSLPDFDFARTLGTYLLNEGLQHKITPEYFSSNEQKTLIWEGMLSIYTVSSNVDWYSTSGPNFPSGSLFEYNTPYYIMVGGIEFGPVMFNDTNNSKYTLGDVSEYFGSDDYKPVGDPGVKNIGFYFDSLSTYPGYIKKDLFSVNPYYYAESLEPQIPIHISTNDDPYKVQIYTKKEVVKKMPAKYIEVISNSDVDDVLSTL